MRSFSCLALRLLPIVGVAAAATGCGSTAPSAPPSSPVPTVSSPPTASTSAPSSGSPSPRADPVAACRTEDMSAVITAQPHAENVALVRLTNVGPDACRVDGWVHISLVNAANKVVDVDTETVDQPGPPTPTTVQPEGSAWAGIKWTTCDKGSSDCAAGNTLKFSLEASVDGRPAELAGFPNPEASDITMGSLQVGSLQPSRQGVVAW
ncbi:DUF4232 domain-containing protein [Micromonospora sp. WMMD882]|uniref:DUF4232 domain-containing protein n=1 Tax=Micromonospora sp. WMMD882 TaxID=3015151 RepID=UPI00248B5914|nr:DUF4232 domain-containing protein [Micromonospora sp. WMMD882]WBB77904.1 DUF4232 domain-containing protein [Micromonospora sp. WMMD882]